MKKEFFSKREGRKGGVELPMKPLCLSLVRERRLNLKFLLKESKRKRIQPWRQPCNNILHATTSIWNTIS